MKHEARALTLSDRPEEVQAISYHKEKPLPANEYCLPISCSAYYDLRLARTSTAPARDEAAR